jgi:hypothetical protein
MLARARSQLAHSRRLATKRYGDVAQSDIEYVMEQESCAFQRRQTLHGERQGDVILSAIVSPGFVELTKGSGSHGPM